MATQIYKHTDASAPQMTSAAGSLLAVLDACLVNGYGAKSAAGWSKTVVDAPTSQAYYQQGAKAGFAQRLLYVKDDAATPGNATAWCCSACTVAASPVLTNYFWDQNSSSIGILLKADQNTGNNAKWIIIANERSFVLLTKRHDWGERGWAMTLVGDLLTPYADDKGCFSVVGRNNTQGVIAIGGALVNYSNGVVGVYGHPDGTYSFTSYTLWRQMGNVSGRDDTASLKSAHFTGIQLARLDASDTTRYRGVLPYVWMPVQYSSLPFYGIPDELEVSGTGYDSTAVFKHIQFDPVNQTKLFFEVAGFSS